MHGLCPVHLYLFQLADFLVCEGFLDDRIGGAGLHVESETTVANKSQAFLRLIEARVVVGVSYLLVVEIYRHLIGCFLQQRETKKILTHHITKS